MTGICECTSILGPGLGGGHGALQGRYGLVSDQFVAMNVVLANGTMITVNEKQHADLWWAMRGAGHNFGIVTSVSAKIYDVQEPNWAYESFIYTGDKVAGVFETINSNFPNGSQPVDVLTLVLFVNNHDVDPTKASNTILFFCRLTCLHMLNPSLTLPTASSRVLCVAGRRP